MPTNDFRSSAINPPIPTIRPAAAAPATHLTVKTGDTPDSAYSSDLINWVQQALKEGESMLTEESYGEDVEENIKMVMGQYKDMKSEMNKPLYRSNFTESRVGKNVNDIASAITDFRPTWHHKTFNFMYERQGQILDKLSIAWWYNNYIDLKMQLLVKQSLVARTAYAYVTYNPTLNGGLGDIDIVVKDYRDVIPIRPNSKISIQDSYGVIIRSRNTVNWAKARYGDKAANIRPTSEGSYLRNAVTSKFRVSSPALDYLDSQRKKTEEFAIPLYDHYEIYIKDPSINASGARKWIGPGPVGEHPWGYWVEPKAALYPRGRLVIMANMLQILYDGGNPYWHGMFPVAKLTLDPMPWSFLGKSALADAKSPQLAVIEIGQGIMDATRKALRPGIIADKNAVSRQVLERFDSREPGFKLKTNPSAGQGVIMEQPMPLPPYILDQRNYYNNNIDYVMGVLDMRALEQVRDMNGNMDVEAMLEYLGPSIRTRGRVLEVFLREVGEMMKFNFFQFYNMGRRIQILGKDGLDFEDYDYDPGSLVPSGPAADLGNEASRFYNVSKDENGFDKYDLKPRAERAAEHARSFVFFLTPGSLLNMSKKQDQLVALQLFRMGVLDPQSLLEKLDWPNVGELPGAPATVLERLAAAAQAGAVGAVSAAGRKSSGQQMPQLRPDLKISESG